MKSINGFGPALIDIVVVLCGLVMLLGAGYVTTRPIPALLDALGTSLVAAGFVSYLIRRFHSEQQRKAIEIVSSTKLAYDDEYREFRYRGAVVDIVGVALSAALKEMATDHDCRMLKRVLSDGARVRLMFISPSANCVKLRAVEDGVSARDLQETLKRSVAYCVAIYRRLERLYTSATESGQLQRSRMGGLEIATTDMCPHCTVYRVDGTILWGVYTAAGTGLYSAVLRVPSEQEVLFNQLSQHFDKLWEKSFKRAKDRNWLVRFTEPNAPMLNRSTIKSLLGPHWQTYLSEWEELLGAGWRSYLD